MFLVNSRYPRLAATPASSPSESVHQLGHALSRSYGINLQSSFTRVLSSALVFSTHLPVSVYGTVTRTAPPAVFLGSIGSTSSPAALALDTHHVSALFEPFDRTRAAYTLEPGIPTTGSSTCLRPCWFLRQPRGAGILTCFPSPTPVGLGLGSD